MEASESQAVKAAIVGSAPERREELEKLWEEHSPQVNQASDKEGFTLEAGSFGLILFDYKTMCNLWLFGFSTQEAFNLFLPYLYLSQITKIPFNPHILTEDDSKSSHALRIDEIIRAIRALKEAGSIENINWPSSVPKPDSGKPSDLNGSMAFDLLCMVAAYCFLHEFRHVQIRNEGKVLDIHEEEFECDSYARDFLLGKIDEYSNTTGYDKDLLINKRSMAMALASVLLYVVTPEAYWNGSLTHPAISERIKNISSALEVKDDDYFWTYLSCALISVVRIDGIKIQNMVIVDQKSYALFLIQSIEKHLKSQSTRTQ
ncbi:phage exclusion protein Lit family protein [Pseudoalteromonas sp. DY56-GL79]|uniref:phage exclusion protein Lit family protein n=1 Tax=Pseudoalteromonas sp. DY56-GL79 TaxID=2967131 RepID=UPI00352A5F19